MLDGQLREIDEDFEVAGKTASAPGHFGDPAEDCNCRCILTQRARWELDEKELNTLKERAAYFDLDKSKDFEDFREKYLKLPENADKIKTEMLSKPTGSDNPTYNAFFDTLNNKDVYKRQVYAHGYYAEIPLDKLSKMIVKMIGNKWVKNNKAVVQVVHFCSEIGLLKMCIRDRNKR